MSGWHEKRCRKVVKAYTEFGLKKKIKDNETREWKQLGEIKTENSNSGAYAVLMEMEIERKVKHA